MANQSNYPKISIMPDEIDMLLFQYNKAAKERHAPEMTGAKFAPLLAEYKAFLELKLDGTLAVPSDCVDHVWHAHILCTKEYFTWCGRHNGGNYLHHDPSSGTKDAYEATLAAYAKLHHRSAPVAFWPRLQSMKEGPLGPVLPAAASVGLPVTIVIPIRKAASTKVVKKGPKAAKKGPKATKKQPAKGEDFDYYGCGKMRQVSSVSTTWVG